CRRARLHLAVQRVRDRSDKRDDRDRCERGRHRGPLPELRREDQQRHDDDPAADAEERAEEAREDADGDESHLRILRAVEDASRVLAPLVADPSRAAVLLDVDGTLAPIVPRPELAEVPEETRAELRRLASKYALLACISGRTGADAWRLVGVDGIVYVGVHGLELAPNADAWRAPLRPFAG